jgi:hypothetical protein
MAAIARFHLSTKHEQKCEQIGPTFHHKDSIVSAEIHKM